MFPAFQNFLCLFINIPTIILFQIYNPTSYILFLMYLLLLPNYVLFSLYGYLLNPHNNHNSIHYLKSYLLIVQHFHYPINILVVLNSLKKLNSICFPSTVMFLHVSCQFNSIIIFFSISFEVESSLKYCFILCKLIFLDYGARFGSSIYQLYSYRIIHLALLILAVNMITICIRYLTNLSKRLLWPPILFLASLRPNKLLISLYLCWFKLLYFFSNLLLLIQEYSSCSIKSFIFLILDSYLLISFYRSYKFSPTLYLLHYNFYSCPFL